MNSENLWLHNKILLRCDIRRQYQIDGHKKVLHQVFE